MTKFLFVSGLQRSGTTALCLLLNHHPHLVIGIERYKFVYARRMQEVGPQLLAEPRFFDISPEETNIMVPQEYRAMRAKFKEAAYVGDKVPGLFAKFAALRERLPGCAMVFIARAPDFVAASWQARADDPADRWPETNDHAMAVKRWNSGMSSALDLARRYPGTFVPVVYETLFSGERSSLEALLAHFGLSLEPELARAYAEITAGWHERAAHPPRLTSEQSSYVRKTAEYGLLDEMARLAREAPLRKWDDLNRDMVMD